MGAARILETLTWNSGIKINPKDYLVTSNGSADWVLRTPIFGTVAVMPRPSPHDGQGYLFCKCPWYIQ
jgi:hypothetical protein